VDVARVADAWGVRFALLSTGVKLYSVCAASHAPIEALLALQHEFGLRADDVAAIEVILSPFADRLVGAPFEPHRNPEVTAQLSVRYALASVLLRGRIGFAELDAAAVLDPAIAQIAARIAVRVDRDNRNELAPATLRVTTTSNGVLERVVTTVPGSPEAPIGDAAFRAKLEACADFGSPAMPRARLERLIAAVDALEDVDDMAEFASMLCG
jgi:2-methylcitrate dehydratase PrpD